MIRITTDDGKKAELLHAICDECASLRVEVEWLKNRLRLAEAVAEAVSKIQQTLTDYKTLKALAAWKEGKA